MSTFEQAGDNRWVHRGVSPSEDDGEGGRIRWDVENYLTRQVHRDGAVVVELHRDGTMATVHAYRDADDDPDNDVDPEHPLRGTRHWFSRPAEHLGAASDDEVWAVLDRLADVIGDGDLRDQLDTGLWTDPALTGALDVPGPATVTTPREE